MPPFVVTAEDCDEAVGLLADAIARVPRGRPNKEEGDVVAHNLLAVSDLAPTEITTVLDLSERPDLPRVLEGRGAALVFEFPSARTRNAAEMAVVDLGGHPVTIRGEEIGFDVRESVEDVARTLGLLPRADRGPRRRAPHARAHGAPRSRTSGVAVPVVNLLSPTSSTRPRRSPTC